jgi:hypothetical protein
MARETLQERATITARTPMMDHPTMVALPRKTATLAMVPASPNLAMAMARVALTAMVTATFPVLGLTLASTLVREATRVVPITLVPVVLGRERMAMVPLPHPAIPTVPPMRYALAANA